jgi:trimeric autotransporter adhesin
MTGEKRAQASGLARMTGRLSAATAVALVPTAVALVAVALAGAGRAGAVSRPGASGPDVISTVAGGPGGPARATSVALATYNASASPINGHLCGLAYGNGRLYIGDDFTVRAVNPASDWLTTVAGTGVSGPLDNGGPAVRASVSACGVAVDHSGNLVIASNRDNRIRVVAECTGTFYGRAMTAGHLYFIAGTGRDGFNGDGGLATGAELAGPLGVTVDAAGNVLIADTYNQRVRVIAEHTGTFYGQAMTAGHIYTIAGAGAAGFSGDGGPATSADLNLPEGVAVDRAGNVVIDDYQNNRIRVVAESTGTFYGRAMTAGDIYTVAGGGSGGLGDGGPATSATLNLPSGVHVDSAGNLLIADTHNERLRVVAESTGTFYGQAMTAGDIYTIAGNGTQGNSGDGGPASSAELNEPDRVILDANGNVVIAEFGSVGVGQQVRVVAESTGTFYGRAMTAGDIYAIAGDDQQVQFSGDGGPATRAELYQPLGVVVDGAGNWVITDGWNNRVRVIAQRTGTFYGRAMTAGDIYTVAGDGKQGFAGDGRPAASAELNQPNLVALDSGGNVLIADQGNERIRVVAEHTGTFYGQAMTAGDIYTIAGTGQAGYSGDGGPATSAELQAPAGVAVDAAGNVVLADTNNNRVRLVAEHTGTFYGQAMTAGDIYTIAGDGTAGYSGDGGPAATAEVYRPNGVLVDSAGNLVIADSSNNRIRVIAETTGTFYGQAMTAGDIYTIAGDGNAGYSGDGGLATSAELDSPYGVAIDGAGNVVIADTFNNRVRVIAETAGRFYGQAMTAGDIYTIAGTGKPGFFGDSGLGTHAELSRPNFVAADGGDLLITDRLSNRIRMVSG